MCADLLNASKWHLEKCSCDMVVKNNSFAVHNTFSLHTITGGE